MFLWILALWIINISQFAFMFPMSLNVTVMNVYLSVFSDNLRIVFINWKLIIQLSCDFC